MQANSDVGTGAWFLTYAATLQPFYGAAALYAKTPGATLLATHQAGQMTPEYTASFGKYNIHGCILVFIAGRFYSALHGGDFLHLPHLHPSR